MIVALLYLTTGALGITFAIPPGIATPIWPPSGIALAAYLLYGRPTLPGVFIGSSILNSYVSARYGHSLPVGVLLGVLFALGSTAQTFVGGELLRFFSPRRTFNSPWEVIKFVAITALSCGIASLVGATLLAISAKASFGVSAMTWYLGDLIGIMVVTPVVLIFAQRQRDPATTPSWEGLAFGLILLVANWQIFGNPRSAPVSYALMPFIFWAAFRFRQRGIAATMITTSCFAVWGTVHGLGPFAMADVPSSLLYCQAYLGVVNITGLFLSSVIAETRRSQRALAESENQFRTMFELAGVGKFQLDPSTSRFQRVNRKFALITGFHRDALTSLPLEELISSNARARVMSSLQPLISGKIQDWSGEVPITRENGVEIALDLSATLLKDEDGKPWQIIAIAQDITERKTSEQERRRLTHSLEHANRELHTFTYGVSHDLKEPLRTIASHLTLLSRRMGGKLDEDSKEFLNYAVDAAKRMMDLVDSLLRYGRIDSVAIELRPTDMNAILQKVLLDLKGIIETSHCEITYDSLPYVKGSPPQLLQLLGNLLANAIKFHGHRAPHIHISAQLRGERWVFSVKDNGLGIAAENWDRIFLPFQRLHSADAFNGSGLGLTVCRKIVELHQGEIWVASQLGEGSEFIFSLPVCDAANVTTTVPTRPLAPLSPSLLTQAD